MRWRPLFASHEGSRLNAALSHQGFGVEGKT